MKAWWMAGVALVVGAVACSDGPDGAPTAPDNAGDSSEGDVADDATGAEDAAAAEDATVSPGADAGDAGLGDASSTSDASDIESDASDIDTDSADATDVAENGDADEGDASEGDGDGSGDAADDAADVAEDIDEGGCTPVEIETVLLRCDGVYRYAGTFRDVADKPECAPFVRLSGVEGEWSDVDAAVTANACDEECRWRFANSFSLLRCGVRTGYIELQHDTCGALFEFAEGLYPSVEAWERANPCPDVDRPPGQCLRQSECGGEFGTCAVNAPGGICNGCTSDSHCPGSTECVLSTCRQPCREDLNCPAGMVCGSANLCIIQSCQRGACPDARFGCNARDLCERSSCVSTDDCPAGTLCQASVCNISL
jgi:hypothetical protein